MSKRPWVEPTLTERGAFYPHPAYPSSYCEKSPTGWHHLAPKPADGIARPDRCEHCGGDIRYANDVPVVLPDGPALI